MSEPTTTDLSHLSEAEIDALHCLGMCSDWAGHSACEGESGLQEFLLACADGLRWQRDEIARLRAALAERPRGLVFIEADGTARAPTWRDT